MVTRFSILLSYEITLNVIIIERYFINKTEMFKVGDILEAQKAQSF